ncbi:MAG: hypothetical protein ACUVWX_14525, partial [Kiritimatiellia bacterium]
MYLLHPLSYGLWYVEPAVRSRARYYNLTHRARLHGFHGSLHPIPEWGDNLSPGSVMAERKKEKEGIGID